MAFIFFLLNFGLFLGVIVLPVGPWLTTVTVCFFMTALLAVRINTESHEAIPFAVAATGAIYIILKAHGILDEFGFGPYVGWLFLLVMAGVGAGDLYRLTPGSRRP